MTDLPLPPQLNIEALHTVTPNLADLPHLQASSGEEWQFKISIVKAHIGRSSGRSPPKTGILLSGMAIVHCLLQLEFILADQLADIYFISPLQVILGIMIQLGLIFQILLCIICVSERNGETGRCFV